MPRRKKVEQLEILEVESKEPAPEAIAEAPEPPAVMPVLEWVNIGDIDLNSGTQTRISTNQAKVKEYAEIMQDGIWIDEKDPPVVFTASDRNTYYPGDGHHRIPAKALAGFDAIFCEVRIDADPARAALFYSLQANRFHGQQLTNHDKRKKAEIALLDPEWSKMSNYAIAEHIGVSAPFVGRVRNELESAGKVEKVEERVSRKGNTIKAENIGKSDRPAQPPSNTVIVPEIPQWQPPANSPEPEQPKPAPVGELIQLKPSASLEECLASLYWEFGQENVTAAIAKDNGEVGIDKLLEQIEFLTQDRDDQLIRISEMREAHKKELKEIEEKYSKWEIRTDLQLKEYEQDKQAQKNIINSQNKKLGDPKALVTRLTEVSEPNAAFELWLDELTFEEVKAIAVKLNGHIKQVEEMQTASPF